MEIKEKLISFGFFVRFKKNWRRKMAKKLRSSDPVLDELVAIKKLLVLMLLKDGLTLAQIGTALGIDKSNVSRMVPTKDMKNKIGKSKKR